MEITRKEADAYALRRPGKLPTPRTKRAAFEKNSFPSK